MALIDVTTLADLDGPNRHGERSEAIQPTL
jgi:hypothetical protein